MKYLNETIQAIRDLDNIVTFKEWNKIAEEYNFLSSFTLRKIYGMNFHDLCKYIRNKRQ